MSVPVSEFQKPLDAWPKLPDLAPRLAPILALVYEHTVEVEEQQGARHSWPWRWGL